MSDKRGLWFLVAPISFFMIVLILIGFVAVGLSSNLIMKMTGTIEKSKGGVVVLNEEDLEIENLYNYTDDYVERVEGLNDIMKNSGWSYG